MPEYEKLVHLLEQKRALFSDFLEATLVIKSGTEDEMDALEAHILQRSLLIEKIDHVDVLVDQICSNMAGGSKMKDVVRNKADFGSLTEAEQTVYLTAQELRRIISIALREDALAVDHMKRMMDRLQENIKKNNINVKMAGYYRSMQQTADKGAFYNQKG